MEVNSSEQGAEILLEYQNDSTLDLDADVTADNEEAMEVTPDVQLEESNAKKTMENLKICIDNEPDPENAVTFVKIENDSGIADDVRNDNGDAPKIQVTMKNAAVCQ